MAQSSRHVQPGGSIETTHCSNAEHGRAHHTKSPQMVTCAGVTLDELIRTRLIVFHNVPRTGSAGETVTRRISPSYCKQRNFALLRGWLCSCSPNVNTGREAH